MTLLAASRQTSKDVTDKEAEKKLNWTIMQPKYSNLRDFLPTSEPV
ncbi:hypothetical protein [Aeromonas veronii]|nr:hypothetical protein [Aeromonas veronii]QLH66605.1 hypothetical protein HXV88_09145 [Aeromonas veronii]